MGSVKDLEIVRKPTKYEMGVGRFIFSDRFSVFDWGAMPDEIPSKGAALCLTSAMFFEKLEKEGVRTHYRGVVCDGEVFHIGELSHPVNVMEIDLVRVIHPEVKSSSRGLEYDYSVFFPEMVNFLIPFEFIYRNGLPAGSSIFQRIEKGVDIKEFGLKKIPEPGERLETPILDVSTKLEDTDRYVTWREVKELAKLSDGEIENIKTVLLKINNCISKKVEKIGLFNEDGKIELAFTPERELLVVDALGTLDECRFTYNGHHVSKEILRNIYRNTEWYREVCRAKKKLEVEGLRDWRSLCSNPPCLEEEVKNVVAGIYQSMANELTGIRFFDVPGFKEVIEEYFEIIQGIVNDS
jgi:phosphoribosylaminoimidazole-succinocarboxamide synthase